MNLNQLEAIPELERTQAQINEIARLKAEQPQAESTTAPVDHASLVNAAFTKQREESESLSQSIVIGEIDIPGRFRVHRWTSTKKGTKHASITLKGNQMVYFYDVDTEKPVNFDKVTVWVKGYDESHIEDPQILILLPKGKDAVPYAILG